eukprot:5870452-Pyramimonas_sp.AAC.1
MEKLRESLRQHALLWSKCEKINLGKYQQPTVVSQKTLAHFAVKSYILNVAAIALGMKGLDRRAAPAPFAWAGAAGEAGPQSVEGKATLQQMSHQ